MCLWKLCYSNFEYFPIEFRPDTTNIGTGKKKGEKQDDEHLTNYIKPIRDSYFLRIQKALSDVERGE